MVRSQGWQGGVGSGWKLESFLHGTFMGSRSMNPRLLGGMFKSVKIEALQS